MEFHSIKNAYEIYIKEFEKKLKNKIDIDTYTTYLDNIYYYTYEYINRAEIINKDYQDILDNLEQYTKDFIKYFNELKDKNKDDKKFIKKINNIKKHLQYVGKYLYI